MLDFINIALRTIMCLAFIAFVVRPMLMSMVRREPNTLELEEMAQLAVNSAFREKFSGFYAPRPVAQLEPPSTGKDDATTTAATDAVPETPVIPLTEAEMKALAEELEADIERMMRALEKLKRRVTKDDLTGLLRRDEFFYRLREMMGKSRGGNVSLILIDVDNFKKINDLEGHVVGDHVLSRVGQVLRRCEKAGAEVGRFGGEEFVVAFIGGENESACMAEALRRQIQREVNVTVSVGVATAQKAEWEIRKMVGQADKALYEAKHTGKNRVCLAA